MWVWKHRRVMAKSASAKKLLHNFGTLLMDRLPKGIFHLILFCKVFFPSIAKAIFSFLLLSARKASQLYTLRRRRGSALWQFLLLCAANKGFVRRVAKKVLLKKIYRGKLKTSFFVVFASFVDFSSSICCLMLHQSILIERSSLCLFRLLCDFN